jgi:acylphosphatase
MKHIHLTISGLVQEVGYRSWAVNQANKLGLSGWIKNLPDGKVEISAEGGNKELEQFITSCRKGPPAAGVDHMEAVWGKYTGKYCGFEVVY